MQTTRTPTKPKTMTMTLAAAMLRSNKLRQHHLLIIWVQMQTTPMMVVCGLEMATALILRHKDDVKCHLVSSSHRCLPAAWWWHGCSTVNIASSIHIYLLWESSDVLQSWCSHRMLGISATKLTWIASGTIPTSSSGRSRVLPPWKQVRAKQRCVHMRLMLLLTALVINVITILVPRSSYFRREWSMSRSQRLGGIFHV